MVLTALAEKRLQLMHDLLPKAELIGLLVNPASPVAEPQIREAQAAAHVLGVRLTVLSAASENDFDQVFVSLARQHADALFVSADPSSPANVSTSSRLPHSMQCRRLTNFVNLSKPAD
jgi:putative ABC transport system substrate-binding protein